MQVDTSKGASQKNMLLYFGIFQRGEGGGVQKQSKSFGTPFLCNTIFEIFGKKRGEGLPNPKLFGHFSPNIGLFMMLKSAPKVPRFEYRKKGPKSSKTTRGGPILEFKKKK